MVRLPASSSYEPFGPPITSGLRAFERRAPVPRGHRRAVQARDDDFPAEVAGEFADRVLFRFLDPGFPPRPRLRCEFEVTLTSTLRPGVEDCVFEALRLRHRPRMIERFEAGDAPLAARRRTPRRVALTLTDSSPLSLRWSVELFFCRLFSVSGVGVRFVICSSQFAVFRSSRSRRRPKSLSRRSSALAIAAARRESKRPDRLSTPTLAWSGPYSPLFMSTAPCRTIEPLTTRPPTGDDGAFLGVLDVDEFELGVVVDLPCIFAFRRPRCCRLLERFSSRFERRC